MYYGSMARLSGRCQCRYKLLRFRVIYKMHSRIIDQSRFVYINVCAVVGTHHQRGLYGILIEWCCRSITNQRGLMLCRNFAKARTGILIFLSVVIAWNPPRRMVGCHGKFRFFINNCELLNFLRREHITICKPIVKHAELNIHTYVGCIGFVRQFHNHLSVVVAY